MSVSTAAARANRAVDTEGRTPEELREIVSHWGAELELAPAETIIEWAAATFGERFADWVARADDELLRGDKVLEPLP